MDGLAEIPEQEDKYIPRSGRKRDERIEWDNMEMKVEVDKR